MLDFFTLFVFFFNQFVINSWSDLWTLEEWWGGAKRREEERMINDRVWCGYHNITISHHNITSKYHNITSQSVGNGYHNITSNTPLPETHAKHDKLGKLLQSFSVKGFAPLLSNYRNVNAINDVRVKQIFWFQDRKLRRKWEFELWSSSRPNPWTSRLSSQVLLRKRGAVGAK